MRQKWKQYSSVTLDFSAFTLKHLMSQKYASTHQFHPAKPIKAPIISPHFHSTPQKDPSTPTFYPPTLQKDLSTPQHHPATPQKDPSTPTFYIFKSPFNTTKGSIKFYPSTLQAEGSIKTSTSPFNSRIHQYVNITL